MNKIIMFFKENKKSLYFIFTIALVGLAAGICFYFFISYSDKVNLLYIDAPFNDRVIREYNRLRSDSINGTRKADLTITIEDIIDRTIKKDRKKNKLKVL